MDEIRPDCYTRADLKAYRRWREKNPGPIEPDRPFLGGWNAEQAAHRAEVGRLKAGLEMIRDREALEPSDYIAAYGEPVGSPGDLARAVLEDNEPGG